MNGFGESTKMNKDKINPMMNLKLNIKRKNKARDKAFIELFHAFDNLIKIAPDTRIQIEAPDNGTSCYLHDANIYESIDHQIVIDAE